MPVNKVLSFFAMLMTAGFIVAWGSDLMDKAQKPKVEQKILLVPGN